MGQRAESDSQEVGDKTYIRKGGAIWWDPRGHASGRRGGGRDSCSIGQHMKSLHGITRVASLPRKHNIFPFNIYCIMHKGP
jgi:hypothetical protein